VNVSILSTGADLSGYIAEILKTWGLPLYDIVEPSAIRDLDPAQTPVLILPASSDLAGCDSDVLAYVRGGGTALAFLPETALAREAGLETTGPKQGHLRLRVTRDPAPGLDGELLPVVGRAHNVVPGEGVSALGYLSHTDRFEGETVGITESPVGAGRIISFAFDLPLAVLLLRQGDPNLAEVIPEADQCARPSHLAVDIGPNDAGWVPYADLLALLFVDMVKRWLPAPVPVLSHLPGEAPGILLYSGDEDNADVAWNNSELDYLTSVGVRMNLYIIPNSTHSTPSDVERYMRHHDVGPHPNLRPLDGQPVSERVAEFERQILMFQDTFGVKARSYRNHCHAWAGYLEPVEVLERLGIRMDANYMCSNYRRHRSRSPYVGFGAAMPMKYCTPEGRVIDVVQQHTHLADDTMFSESEYSYRYSLQQFEVLFSRTLSDIANRFHTPYGVNIHPSNWVKFSRQQGEAMLRQAAEQEVPVWSWDQWSTFWDARDTWRFASLEWRDSELRLMAEGTATDARLRLACPLMYGKQALVKITVNGRIVPYHKVSRYRQSLGLVELAGCDRTADIVAQYV
jgi:hypothetical protein